jgi:hypothetical protein
MTSKVFYCSKQRAMQTAQEVLREMKLRESSVNNAQSLISAHRGWRFLSPPREIEVKIFTEDQRVEVAINIETNYKLLDFGGSEYSEEDFLFRMKERIG